ncbi:MAG: histidine kinase N-terminal 7TM domain-containing protein, partial [Candidatus Aminicenantales bacterium]
MNFTSSLYYFIALVLTCLLSGALAVYSLHRKETRGASALFWVAVGEALLAFTEILSIMGGDAGQALFWFKTRHFFSALLPVFWLRFAVDYSSRKIWIPRWLSAGLFVLPLLTQILIWTNGRHHLFVKREVEFVHNGPFWVADISVRKPGIWFLVHSTYGLLLLIAGVVLVLATGLRRRPRDTRQMVFIGLGGAVAVATGVVSALNLLPYAEFNPYTPGLGLSFLFFTIAVFGPRFFENPKIAAPPAEDLKSGRSFATFLFIFSLFATGLIALGLMSLRDFQENLKSQAESELQSVANLKIQELANWRRERLADANILFQNSKFITLAGKFLKNPADAAAEKDVRSWLSDYRVYEQYERIFILDANGAERMSIEGSGFKETFPLSREPNEKNAIAHDRVTLLDLHRDAGEPIHLSLLLPVNSIPSGREPARWLGFVVFWISAEYRLYPFIREWPGPSASAETLLVRRDKNAALFLNDLRYDPRAALNLRIPLERTDVCAVQAILGREGVIEGLDYRNTRVLAAVGPVPDSPWFLVARMDLAEINAPARDRMWQTMIFLAALIAAAGMGFGAVWRSYRLRYFRGQAEVGQKLRESLERFELANKATFDVVWDWTLQTDALWWNENFHLLFGFSPEETEPGIESWTNRIHPEDRDRIVSGIHAVIDGGRQFWSDHYRFRCQDGRYLEIFDRGSVTRDATGKPVRMIGAMQDLTERIAAEKSAIHSRDLMRYIIEHDRSAIALLVRDFRVLFVCQGFH